MEHISRGGRATLAPMIASGVFHAEFAVHGLALDLASFGLDASGKLLGEPYMTFFNQPVTPCGGVKVRDGQAGTHTRYGAAMEAVRRYYFPDGRGAERRTAQRAELPVYVMFVTDGGTSDKSVAERQLRWSSHEGIFWQFMGIGKGRKSKSRLLASFADSDFPFLESLDELPGRLVDNANFFSVASPDEHSDAQLYDLLMTEYPDWLKAASSAGLLA